MSNRSYLVPRPPAFDHEHPRPKEEGEVLYCGNCSNGTYHGFLSPKSKPYGAAAPNGGYVSSTANHTRRSSSKYEGKRNERQ